LENRAERSFSHQANKKSPFAIWAEAALQAPPTKSVALLGIAGQEVFQCVVEKGKNKIS
jgi:hypothetical protein